MRNVAAPLRLTRRREDPMERRPVRRGYAITVQWDWKQKKSFEDRSIRCWGSNFDFMVRGYQKHLHSTEEG